MANNTRSKEMQELQKLMEQQAITQQQIQIQLEKFTGALADTDSRIEVVEAKLDDLLLQRLTKSIVHDGSSSSSSPIHLRHVKPDFPKFDSTGVLDWIFRAEQFFSYYSTPDTERLTIVVVHMEKIVVPWFQMLQKAAHFLSWQQLVCALEEEFGPSPFECTRAALFKLQKDTTVNAYYLEFMALANRVEGLTAPAILDCFELRREVLAQAPVSLVKAVSLVKLYEEKFTTSFRGSYAPTYGRNTQNNTSFKTSNRQPSHPLLPTPSIPPNPQLSRPYNVKRVPPTEMLLRREKGLCYNCDEKFTTTHRCPNKGLMVLFDEAEDEKPQIPQPMLNEEVNFSEMHHLSLNALHGSTGRDVMKFTGILGGMQVQILVDGGSSENFLQPRITKCLQFPIQQAPPFKVRTGSGNVLLPEGMISNITVTVQGHPLNLQVYLLQFAGTDLILGTKWLKSIGPHIADYDAMQLRIVQDGRFITLKGEIGSATTESQLHQLVRMQRTEAIAELFTMQLIKEEGPVHLNLPEHMEPELATLLQTYRSIFAEPTGFPPKRTHEHAITLLKDTGPVKVRPYRYAHSQKEEIEKMVQDMLSQGIIQPSKSPFSSPIILVKKKDGT